MPLILQKIFFDVIARFLWIRITADRSLSMSVKEMMIFTKKNYFNLNSPEHIKSNLFTKKTWEQKVIDQIETNEDSSIQITSNIKDELKENSGIQNKLILKSSPFMNGNNLKRKKSNVETISKNKNPDILENTNEDKSTNPAIIIASSSSVFNKNSNRSDKNVVLPTSLSSSPSTFNENEKKQFSLVLASLNRNLDKNELREAMVLYKQVK